MTFAAHRHQRHFDLVLLHLLDVEGAASIGPAGESGDDLRRQLLATSWTRREPAAVESSTARKALVSAT
ncbi:hypothetical protein C8D77_1327 [Mesorhizobium loti]|uniref:Uncharacterized protein n=1 Tax=Rhizobium loti TaxID=381 RepID=A0A8E3B1B7_RHILI|nr:hypothetical protein [Mesorhizobium loti]PWJ84683.1 hypothetical protein C8D77_1327 [Mesorhizobium loti]